MARRHAVEFFESKFRRRVAEADYALSDVERLVLPYVRGTVLDLGCGLANLSLEAARRGCRVVAIDASPTAIAHVKDAATAEGLDVVAEEVDLGEYEIVGTYDTVLAVGLLMFLPEERARFLLRRIKDAVRPGGIAAVCVLVEGTTYMEMFDPAGHFLFNAHELRHAFADWEILAVESTVSPAPMNTVKVFSTVIAKSPLECDVRSG